MNKLEMMGAVVTVAEAAVLAVRPHARKPWHGESPEVIETFRKIHASKEFTREAAHKAFAGAKFVK